MPSIFFSPRHSHAPDQPWALKRPSISRSLSSRKVAGWPRSQSRLNTLARPAENDLLEMCLRHQA